MLAEKQMNDLAERRRLLVTEADLHRSIIAMELEGLRSRVDWLVQARDRVSAGKPWLAAGSVLAGLLAVRNWRKLAAWAPTAFSALRWMGRFRRR